MLVSIRAEKSAQPYSTSGTWTMFYLCPLPRGLKRILEHRHHQMLTIVRAGAGGAGAEAYMSKQGCQSVIESFVIQGFANQRFFCLSGAPGSWAAGTNGDANLTEHIIRAFKPNRKINDR